MTTIIAFNIYKKIWKLEYYQIYVNWQLRILSSVAAFDYDARCAFYIAYYLRISPKVTLLLVHRLRYWANIKLTLGK